MSHSSARLRPEAAQPCISVRGLTRTHQRGSEQLQALAGIDLEIQTGAFVAVMGPSGCGKTTLLNLLAGVDRPSAGEIWIDGQRLDRLNETRLAVLRRRQIGLIFQSFNLLSNMTALENVMLPALLIGCSAGEARKRASALLEELGLGARTRKLPGELSGGQQQRVAIARALINEPAVLLADEPTGNLDAQTGQQVLRLLKRLHAQGQTIMLVTHDAQVASQAERIIIMRDGHIIDETNGHSTRRESSRLLSDVSQFEMEC